MFRRFATILLIAGYLAGQLAGIPHAHAATAESEQSHDRLPPHFHVGGADHCHGHAHEQGDHSHDHSHHDSDSDAAAKPLQPVSEVACIAPSALDHDSNAVYLPLGASSSIAGKFGKSLGSDEVAGPIANALTVPTVGFPDSFSSTFGRPPAPSIDGSGLYLALRQLRI